MPAPKHLLILAAATSVLAAAALMARPAPPADTSPVPRVPSVCASRDVDLRGQPHRLVAVCHRAMRETTPNDPATVDLYVLRREGGAWHPVAQRLGVESGRAGQPGEVAVLQLGPSFYGFEFNDTWVSQGYLLGGSRLYVPRGDGFHPALEYTTSLKNSGARECFEAPAACSDFSRRLQVEPQQLNAGAYALRITSRGSFRGEPVSASHVLSFDARKTQYRLPAGFEAQVE